MTDESHAQLVTSLKQHEGLRLRGYRDSRKVWTIGYGHNVEAGPPIPIDAADLILASDLDHTLAGIRARWPWFDALDEVRQRVVAEMAFNLGVPGLARFRLTLAAIERGDYASASVHMLNSLWAAQVGQRATRLANQMKTGSDDPR